MRPVQLPLIQHARNFACSRCGRAKNQVRTRSCCNVVFDRRNLPCTPCDPWLTITTTCTHSTTEHADQQRAKADREALSLVEARLDKLERAALEIDEQVGVFLGAAVQMHPLPSHNVAFSAVLIALPHCGTPHLIALIAQHCHARFSSPIHLSPSLHPPHLTSH